MFGLKSVYLYLISCQITLIKFLKKLYFSSKNYNKSLESKTPQQVYYNPNPFLLSIITSYSDQSFKISEIDPNIFWIENKKKDTDQKHDFFWLNLLDRNADHKKLKKIIYIWIFKYSKYKRKIWETSTLSARIISWILNTDIILKLSANNGTNYSTATLTALPDFATGIKMAKVNDLTVTAGTQLKYKIEFANQSSGSKEARIRGVSLQY